MSGRQRDDQITMTRGWSARVTISPSFELRAKALMPCSISAASSTLIGLTSTLSDGAMAWMMPNWAGPVGVAEFRRTASRVTLGATCLRREPLEVRKQTLASLLRGSLPGVLFNAHLTHPGDIVFEHACKMGLEGIVSKRLGSTYRSGRSPTGSSSRTRRLRR